MQLGAEQLNVNNSAKWDNFYVIPLRILTKKKQNTRREY